MALSLNDISNLVIIASILCGFAYKLGYDNGKNAKK